MKIAITLKDPDGVHECINDMAVNMAKGVTFCDTAEAELFVTNRRDRLAEKCRPFVEYGEYVTIEIDTDTNTAIVVPVKR